MKYELKAYSIWEYGQRKDAQGNPHQEDNIYPEHGHLTGDDRLFILCDGMGGHDAGEVASATVCRAMSQAILNNGHDHEGVFTIDDFNAALNAAFAALDAKDNGAEKKMGTTMTMLKLHNNGATIAHMGDSRVYHIRPGKTGDDTRIVSVTEDHSLVNDLIKAEEMTREEARTSKIKNIITRAMQPHMDHRPKATVHTTTDIRPGDYFYLCSDGMLEQPEMDDGTSLRNIFSEMGGSDEEKIEILRSVTEGNRDNHTAIIIHITNVTDPIAQQEAISRPDKFAAIVNDDDATADQAADPAKDSTANQDGDTEAAKDSTDNAANAKKDAGKATADDKAPSSNRSEKKGIMTLILRFLSMAVIAVAIVVGYKSLTDTKPKEKPKEEQRKQERGIDRKPQEPVVHSDPRSTTKDSTTAESNQTTPEVSPTKQDSPKTSTLQTEQTISAGAATALGSGGDNVATSNEQRVKDIVNQRTKKDSTKAQP